MFDDTRAIISLNLRLIKTSLKIYFKYKSTLNFIKSPKIQFLFDVDWYRNLSGLHLEFDLNPLYHYLKFGYKEDRSPHPLFDEQWYRSQNPDVVKSDLPGLYHYLKFGYKEDRSPNNHTNLNLLNELYQ